MRESEIAKYACILRAQDALRIGSNIHYEGALWEDTLQWAFDAYKSYGGWDPDLDPDWAAWSLKATQAEIVIEGLRRALA